MKREKAIEVKSFGNNGWFMWFKAHANLHNLKVQGEVAGGNLEAASEFSRALANTEQVNHRSKGKELLIFYCYKL